MPVTRSLAQVPVTCAKPTRSESVFSVDEALRRIYTDPYSGMNLALANFLGIPYPTLQILVNVGFFIIQLLWGRSLLGPGTIANAFGLGPVIQLFDHSLTAIFLGNRPGRQTSGK